MTLIDRLYAATSERRLCEEVRFNLAYRWFCRLALDGPSRTTRRSARSGTAASATSEFSACCSSRP
ncbi:transposase [Sphingomonas sp. AP4-R1]|uniref:transposase n=1 Tax=Sphingomonas sp. AP4-R1 TaxID=2735134 RepID=UPI0020A40862|nr:transposase [Sphingomonas sp. AP4-R1]